ncbi:hypothetical protein HDU77_004152 [Chytriomyces hyalinus]|nr:hypothetical protein HDU77_004152 [Chytriomyces hyalinus]
MSKDNKVPFIHGSGSGNTHGAGMHSHDGVNFHGSHSAPAPPAGQHSHDGINFHGSHDAPDYAQQQQQMQMLMRMMQLQQQQQQQQGQHSHDGVNFHGAHQEPLPGQHSHDGVNFHGSHDGGHAHGGAHGEEPKDEAGSFADRVMPYTKDEGRDWKTKGFSIGIAGPVGSGKTALLKKLCTRLSKDNSLVVIVNDLYTTIDAQSIIDEKIISPDRVKGLTTGIWSRVAIDEDIEDNFVVAEAVSQKFSANFVIIEAAGDNLGANFDRNLSDFTIFVLDTASGEKMPLKGGKGVTQSDLLVINKTDLAPLCEVNLTEMEANARKMRAGDKGTAGPIVMAQIKNNVGVDAIVDAILKQYELSGAKKFFAGRK